MRALLFLTLLAWAAVCAAQTMYKCTDARQRVTYSNESCEKLGLKDAGPVAERTTTMPLAPPPQPAARKDAAKAPAPRAKDDADAERGGAQVKPVVPLLEKLLK